MKTKTVTIYACEHCGRKYTMSHYCKKHEAKCYKNPERVGIPNPHPEYLEQGVANFVVAIGEHSYNITIPEQSQQQLLNNTKYTPLYQITRGVIADFILHNIHIEDDVDMQILSPMRGVFSDFVNKVNDDIKVVWNNADAYKTHTTAIFNAMSGMSSDNLMPFNFKFSVSIFNMNEAGEMPK